MNSQSYLMKTQTKIHLLKLFTVLKQYFEKEMLKIKASFNDLDLYWWHSFDNHNVII